MAVNLKRLNYCEVHYPITLAGVRDVLAPYSSAAQVDGGLEFYRRIRKEEAAAREELSRAADFLADEINSAAERIVSIADPYALPNMISETDLRRFAIPYLAQTLSRLDAGSGRLVHICPYSSLFLAEFGFAEVLKIPAERKLYCEKLLDYARAGKPVLLGHQCIHTEMTGQVYILQIRVPPNQVSCHLD